ncbi:MAG: hypothetical protein J6J36_07470 [Clostridia bacterium]|nr:hypothetical protein [Clostridia bacterium]
MADVEENDISEKIFENEISINELIEYVVDEIFPKFPEFCDLFESNDEIKEILKKRVVSIERRKTNYKDRVLNNSPAEYSVGSNKIIFYADEPITIDNIKNSNKWKNIFAHEFIHAATDKTKSSRYYEVGCSSSGKKNKFIIFKELVLSLIFLPGKNMMKKIRGLFVKLKYMSSYNLGDALNEGLTAWITDKMVPYVKNDTEAYPWEKNFIDSIEEVLGTEETLDLIRCDYKKIAKKFNISKLDSISLIRYMDITSCIANEVDNNDKKEKDIEEYKKNVQMYYTFGGMAQKFFIERVFIPKSYEKTASSISHGNTSVYDLINLYNIMQKYKNYICIEDFSVEDMLGSYSYKTFYEETFDNFESYIKNVLIAFSNHVDVSNWTDEEIFNIKRIYDYMFKKVQEKSEINTEFYKFITDKAKKIGIQQNLMVAMNKSVIFVPGSPAMNGISFKDLAGSIIKKNNISTSDVTLSRRERRAIERENRKKEKAQRQNGKNQNK